MTAFTVYEDTSFRVPGTRDIETRPTRRHWAARTGEALSHVAGPVLGRVPGRRRAAGAAPGARVAPDPCGLGEGGRP